MSLPRLKVVRKPDGRVYNWFRPAGGGPLVKLPNGPHDDPEFLAAYAAAMRAHGAARDQSRAAGGRTMAALADAYVRSPTFAGLAPVTQNNRRRLVHAIAERGPDVAVGAIARQHVEADIARQSAGARSNRLKAWRALFRHAVSLGWRPDDPTAGVVAPRYQVESHVAWTPEDVAAFRARWLVGTSQRTAFELLYWTGARRADAVRLGWQNVRDGWIAWRQQKTGTPAAVPIAPELAEALAACDRGRLTFLETAGGGSRTAAGFGNWFGAACEAAGVAARAHGLRHTMGVDGAEAEVDGHGISALLAHASTRETEVYTRQAERRRLAEKALVRLADHRRIGNRHRGKLETDG